MFSAHMNYVAAVNQGDDGRPDFHARKACNYAEQAIQVVSEFHACCSLLYCFFATHSIDLKHTFWPYPALRVVGICCQELASPKNR